MHYDFTTIYDRHNMDALAVDGVGTSPGFSPDAPKEGFSFLPMWVADMNFATVPTIAQAIAKRIEHPLFGYFRPSQAYFDAIINWQRTQNGVEGLLPEHIGYENGVLGGVVSALNVFCSRGDKVLVLSPTYVGFTSSLENNGYHIIHSALKRTTPVSGAWTMPTWKKRSRSIRFTPPSSARRTIPAAESGSAGSWSRQWSCSESTM